MVPAEVTQPANPWSLESDEVVSQLKSSATEGLSSDEARRRQSLYGRNEIPEPPTDPFWKRYWGQLTGDAVVRLLLIGGLVSFLIGDYLEGSAILLMLNIMALFGLWQEGKATDAARSLRLAENPITLVIRDGKRIELPVVEVVPGDIVYLPTGAIPPADARVISSVRAEADDSILTGEPPRQVVVEPVPATSVMNDQHCMVFRGCGIVSGNVTAIVTVTAGSTNVGQIAQRLAEAEKQPTPLDEQLDSLGDSMSLIFRWLAVVIIGYGVVQTFLVARHAGTAIDFWFVMETLKEAFINAVALIIAAIPEGLPAVLTITLAIATKVMVKRNALIRNPRAVEGGGSMTVLLTDKTGTLTANKMSVTNLFVGGKMRDESDLKSSTNDPLVQRALRVASLCNNNSSSTEAALSMWVNQSGFEVSGDVRHREIEYEFDQSLKRMTTVHRANDPSLLHVFSKGAPERVVELCSSMHIDGRDVPLTAELRQSIEAALLSLAKKGLRVIALAEKVVARNPHVDRAAAESELSFVGLLGIMDPPRDDVAPAVDTLDRAGVRTVMVTGDNPVTAYHVARMVGILKEDMPFDRAVITGEELSKFSEPTPQFLQRLHSVRVFARVTPDHKARIVQAIRGEGYIVGMTGDGVNDAIALRQSDVGFAMGNGTDVAREASDIILMDSRFGTIPAAVEEGRNVLYRIRLYLSYILSGNGCEVGAFIVAYALRIPIPFTALVLLVINFATDSFPALAMAFEAGEKDAMQRPPRKRKVPFINRVMWAHIAVQTVAATVVIMGVYYWVLQDLGYFGLKLPADQKAAEEAVAIARSAAFMAYIWQKLFRAFTARSLTRSILVFGPFSNLWTLGAVAISLAIALFFVYIPVVNSAVGLAPLSLMFMGLTIATGFIPPVVEELTKPLIRNLKD